MTPVPSSAGTGRKSTRIRALFAALLLAIFGLHLAFVLHVERSDLVDDTAGDARPYRERAGEILGGDWIGSEVFFDAPLFPYFLALGGAAPGGSELPIKITHALLGAASAFLIFLITRAFFGDAAGLLAAALYGFDGFALFYDGLLLKPPLAIFLLLLSAELLRRRRGVSAGLALGVATLVRGNFLLLTPVYLIFLGRRSRRGAALFLAGLLVPVLAVTVRNAAVGHDFVPLTYHAGPTFYHGNHPGARGTYAPIVPGRQNPPYEKEDARRIAEEAEGRTLRPSEVSRYWFGRAFAFIAGDPAGFARLTLRRAALFWRAGEIPDTYDFRLYRRFFPELSIATLSFGLLAPLGLIGWFVPRRLRGDALLLPGVVLTFFATLAFLFVFGRYRLPAVPFLAPTAARTLLFAGGLAARRSWARLGGLVAAILLLMALVHAGGRPTSGAAGEYNLGIRYEALGRTDDAEAAYRRAIAANDGFASAWNNLGGILLLRGDREGAAECFRKALAANPAHERANRNAARLARDAGRPGEAREFLRRALETDRSPEALTDLGIVEELDGRPEAAVPLYREALRAGGAPPEAAANLGRILAASGEPGEAIPLLERAAERLPGAWAPRLYLALALAETGKGGEAEAVLERAGGAGADVRALLLRARLLETRGETAAARGLLDEARAEGLPDDATVRLFYGGDAPAKGAGR